MEQRLVGKLEVEIEKAIFDVFDRLRPRELPRPPSPRTMHLMAKAAVTVYETAVENARPSNLS